MKIIKIVTLILFALLPAIALTDMGRQMFKSSDINNDGCIDREEAKAVPLLKDEETFNRFDINGNGCINSVEFRNFLQRSKI